MRELAAELGVPWTPGAFVTGTPVDQEMDRGYSFNYINNAGMRKQLEALIAAAEDANAAGGNYPVPRTNPALAHTVKTRIIAGRSEAPRVVQECVSTVSSRWMPVHEIQNNILQNHV